MTAYDPEPTATSDRTRWLALYVLCAGMLMIVLDVTTVQVGGAIGLAVLATLATERTDGRLAAGDPADSALNAGYHLAYVIGAALVAVAIVVAVGVVRSESAVTPTHDAAPNPGQPAYSEAV